MSLKLLPYSWKTEHLDVEDSQLREAQELQEINDSVPQTRSWMMVEGQEETANPIIVALQEGVLPPTSNRTKEFFRLQSIRLHDSNELVGFLGVYHGFPEDDIFWINTVTFRPCFQGKGYGPELMLGLSDIVKKLGCYTRMRTYVLLTNWPSLRLCVKVGLNTMLEIVGDMVFSEKAEAHVLVEKSL